jgi:hypothetical protein
MTEHDGRIDREGIYIDRDLADSIAIEEELDANIEVEYRFPDPSRRRISGWVYLVAAVVAWLSFEGSLPIAIGFAALSAWHFLSAWPLAIDEKQAMSVSGAAVGFPVGHASAAVRFSGWRSRPRWSVVLYSATEPPDQRALVVVDAVSGEVVETPYVEPISGI